jgi:hypothetical protein
VSDTEAIEWVAGSEPAELTAREQLLVSKAEELGYGRGYGDGMRRGKLLGGADAIKAMTELTTTLRNGTVTESLDWLHQVVAFITSGKSA